MRKEMISREPIERKILMIRGQKVMLDRDLAVLYGVKPIRLREQIKRNRERFPEDFMFQLMEHELKILVSHFAIPSRKYFGGHLPYVFTQEGVAMLSSVLRSKQAIQANIAIMRAFVRLRQIMLAHKDLARRLDKLERKYNTRFRRVFDAIRGLMAPPPAPPPEAEPRKQIGFVKERKRRYLMRARKGNRTTLMSGLAFQSHIHSKEEVNI